MVYKLGLQLGQAQGKLGYAEQTKPNQTKPNQTKQNKTKQKKQNKTKQNKTYQTTKLKVGKQPDKYCTVELDRKKAYSKYSY